MKKVGYKSNKWINLKVGLGLKPRDITDGIVKKKSVWIGQAWLMWLINLPLLLFLSSHHLKALLTSHLANITTSPREVVDLMWMKQTWKNGKYWFLICFLHYHSWKQQNQLGCHSTTFFFLPCQCKKKNPIKPLWIIDWWYYLNWVMHTQLKNVMMIHRKMKHKASIKMLHKMPAS